jgi:hypothetical protein
MKIRRENTIRSHGSEAMADLLLEGDVKVPVRYNGYSKAADKLAYPMCNLLLVKRQRQRKRSSTSFSPLHH